ncbi:MAG: hypothetical protein M1819_000243 [Sarea resinae]|nr:MAG: hypothetical protein M1819_000243 [Sarea resinae]
MAGTGSPPPFIKDEPEDHHFNPNRFMSQQNYGMSQHQFGQSFGAHGDNGSIDPSELSMHGELSSMQNNNYVQFPFGSQQNMSSSFNMGNSGIADDELLDLGDLDDPHGASAGFQSEQQGFGGNANNVPRGGQGSDMFSGNNHGASMPINTQNQMGQVFSATPDGGPIQSPFIQGNFNYDQFRQIQPQQQNFGAAVQTPSSYNASPRMRPPFDDINNGSFENGYLNGRPRASARQGLDRQASDSRSPITPKTPGLSGLNLDTPESGSFPAQPMITHHLGHRHQKSLSNQWDSTPGSGHSYVDSPLSSPGQQSHHVGISEILKSGQHASLPAKVDHHGGTGRADEKRRRRRESHNMVERRRRDNINERIQELSHLVPQHRLEDEKIRKHLVNNSPLSPSVGSSGISPPQATSLLAGGAGKRAAGNITQGIPPDEKDKGPNKGDILNGAVSWTRDLMWALHVKMQQETELADYIVSLGGTFPFEQTEEDKRMRTELMDSLEKNGPQNFAYSRGPGSGLRVPKHTNISGDPSNNPMSPQSLSPANQSSASNSVGQGPPQFWGGMNNGSSGRGSMSFKEEGEFGMDMN